MFSLLDGLEWIDMKDKCNFRAGSLWAICIRVRVNIKKKTMAGTDIYFILSIKRVLDRLGRGAPFIILKKSILYGISVAV